MQHETTPLYDSCLAFLANQTAPLYCPGHKGGRTLPAAFKRSMAELDLNNLTETDTLHCPSGAIGDAEKLLADAYGVKESFMLVGGSSAGNIVSILSTCNAGDEILVQRNAHKSTIAGVVLAGAKPVWLMPYKDPLFGIYHGVDAAQLDETFRTHPKAVGAVLLNPTYYGTVADIRALREVCDRHGTLLLVDEAHGPHFRFHSNLPTAAEDSGADLIVQSTHKLLSGLSQAAVLHKGTDKIPTGRIRKMLQLIQTTSPSFPIMISIDLARRQMMLEGHSMWSKVLEIAAAGRRQLAGVPGVRVLGKEALLGARSGLYDLDETKILIDGRNLGLTGAQLLGLLNQRGIKPELAGPSYVLAILTVGSEPADVEQLCAAVGDIARHHCSSENNNGATRDAILAADLYRQPEQAMLPRESFFGAQKLIPLAAAKDCVSAEIVTPYPPGIPVLMPGERISESILESLLELRSLGFPISASDPTLSHILVVG